MCTVTYQQKYQQTPRISEILPDKTRATKNPRKPYTLRVFAGFCYCLKPFFGGIGAIESSPASSISA
jgi:hypothetical protein